MGRPCKTVSGLEVTLPLCMLSHATLTTPYLHIPCLHTPCFLCICAYVHLSIPPSICPRSILLCSRTCIPPSLPVCDAPSYSNLMQQLMRASGMLVTGPQTSSALRGTQEVVCDLGQHLCCLCLPVLCSKTDGPGFESSSSPVVFIAYS